jgi:hypothetical protein
LSLSWAGCSGGVEERPKTYPVTGQVAYKGKPLVGATVAFWSEGAPRSAEGTTDQEGKFSLSTYELNDGAFEGENKVVISVPLPDSSAPVEAPKDPAAMSQMYQARLKEMKNQKPLLPVKYSKLETTPLKATVKAGENEPFVFQLTD